MNVPNIILIAILLMVPLQIFAEDNNEDVKLIQESDVILEPFNLTASTNQRKDKKGTPCGVIIVESLVEGLEFEKAVGDVEYNQSQYIVYLPAKTSYLKVKKGKSSIKLKFDKIESKQVYRTKISSYADYGRLSVMSTPVGADVYIDNKRVGSTPIKMYLLSPGLHTLSVIQTGYVEDKQTINMTPHGNLQIKCTLDFEPDYKALYKKFR